MPQVELTMPKMGESIIEATILAWVKNVGDTVDVDDTVLEIATDKVDSEVPSPVAGTIAEVRYAVDDVVAVGEVIALIETAAGAEVAASPAVRETPAENAATAPQPAATPAVDTAPDIPTDRYYSPLVRTIARSERVTAEELARLPGSGKDGRVNKSDILAYVKSRDALRPPAQNPAPAAPPPAVSPAAGDEIEEMGRMRRLIADHMVLSKRTSPHVTSFIEVDVTDIVDWRNRVKADFQRQHGQKITYTPVFMEAVARAIKDFPGVNVSVDGTRIIKRADINLGMATALPSGNLIVPVIKQADRLNLLGLTGAVNDLAARARAGKLQPADTQGGTFTVTNVGTFGNVMGTPIINQPQAAILAVGAIRKKPAVVETAYGDLIAVRQMMFLSLSYDHRVVDGFLGGSFLRRIGDYLEAFDPQRTDV